MKEDTQVIGGLVEKKEHRSNDEHTRKGHTHPPSSGQIFGLFLDLSFRESKTGRSKHQRIIINDMKDEEYIDGGWEQEGYNNSPALASNEAGSRASKRSYTICKFSLSGPSSSIS